MNSSREGTSGLVGKMPFHNKTKKTTGKDNQWEREKQQTRGKTQKKRPRKDTWELKKKTGKIHGLS